MNKKIITVFIVITLLFSGCASENNYSNNEYESNKIISFKDGFSEDGKMWFYCNHFAKDTKIYQIFYIKDGKLKKYDNTYDLTLGKAVKMSEDEIIEYLKEKWIEEYQNYPYPYADVEQGEIVVRYYHYSLEDFNNNPNDFSVDDFSLHVYTDDSGNNTIKEELSCKGWYGFSATEGEWEHQDSKEYYKFDCVINPDYIYDTILGGFSFQNSGECIVSKCDLDTVFIFDKPETEGVEVD